MSRYTKTIVGVVTWCAVFMQSMVTEPVFQEVMFDSNVSQEEAWKLLFIALGVAGVFGFKNKPPVGQPADPNISEAAR